MPQEVSMTTLFCQYGSRTVSTIHTKTVQNNVKPLLIKVTDNINSDCQ